MKTSLTDPVWPHLVSHAKIHTNITHKIELVLVTNSNDNNSSSEAKMVKSKFHKDIYQKIKLEYWKATKHADKLSFSTMLFDDLLLNRLRAAAN